MTEYYCIGPANFVASAGLKSVGNGDGSDLTLIIEVPKTIETSGELKTIFKASSGVNSHSTFSYNKKADRLTISSLSTHSQVNFFS